MVRRHIQVRCQGIPVRVGIITQHSRDRCGGQRDIARGGITIILGNRWRIDVHHINRHGRRMGRLAVTQNIGERVGPGKSGTRAVIERPTDIKVQGAVQRTRSEADRQDITIHIDIVGQDTGCCGLGQHNVFICAVVVPIRDRWRVDPDHSQRHRCSISSIAIRDNIGE